MPSAARGGFAPRPALRATVARRPEAAEHDRPQRDATRGSSPNNTDPSGFSSTSGGDVGAMVMGWAGGVTGLAAMQGYGVGLSGFGAGALNPATSLLSGGYSQFGGRAGGTQSVAAPSGAPKGAGLGRDASPGATTENKGLANVATVPCNGSPEYCRDRAFNILLGGGFEGGVFIEGAEVAEGLVARLIARMTGSVGRRIFGETAFTGLVRNRVLRGLTDAEIRLAFEKTPLN